MSIHIEIGHEAGRKVAGGALPVWTPADSCRHDEIKARWIARYDIEYPGDVDWMLDKLSDLREALTA